MYDYDVIVLGAGPAGLAAGYSSHMSGAKTLIIEREEKAGGILKQCIHDGFGVIKFGQKLSGPEYAGRYIELVKKENIEIKFSTFVISIEKNDSGFTIHSLNSEEGVFELKCKSLVLATGCRERTSKQIFMHGTRPAGVYTAGTAQYYTNIMGYLPGKECVILGSGDIGLIMARRLTLEGSKVLGVYEAKSTPSGLTRNLVQCLEDYSIPLELSHTITKIYGKDRVEGVDITEVDSSMKPIPGTEKFIKCDSVILSVGLIPENEIAENLGLSLDNSTKGPNVDHDFMSTDIPGVFSCGNALHVNDLVDYVSESGETAGKNAASYSKSKNSINLINFEKDDNFLYFVPQTINLNSNNKKIIAYFRSKDIRKDVEVNISQNETILFKKKFKHLAPPEMEKIIIDLKDKNLNNSAIKISMQEVKK